MGYKEWSPHTMVIYPSSKKLNVYKAKSKLSFIIADLAADSEKMGRTGPLTFAVGANNCLIAWFAAQYGFYP